MHNRMKIILISSDQPAFEREIQLELNKHKECDPPDIFTDDFDSAIRKFKQKEWRRHLIIESAHQLALKIIDDLEDSEGWNREERREKFLRAKAQGYIK